MAEESEVIFDVTEDEFEARVVGASSERLVVVDFWAPWCAPCRVLGPVLEKVVASFGGGVTLAKLNVDEAPTLSSRYGVRGVPTVKVFREGEIVAEFVGARGEAEIRRMLEALVPSEADVLVTKAAELAGAGRNEEGEAMFREALAKRPDHTAALVGLAHAALEKGDHDAAREALSRVDPGSPGSGGAEGLSCRLDFVKSCEGHGGKEAVEKLAAEKPGDTEAMYASAMCLAAEGSYREALEMLLRLVEQEAEHVVENELGYRSAAKDAMVQVFTVVGKRSALADEYRSKLARALY